MELRLEGIEQRVGAQIWLHRLDLRLEPRAVTVLLGATQAGKTTLMRVMAGLDKPSAGRVLADGTDVTGMPVRQRNVAMVYQQFINYPSMTVADNIASPLRLRREGGIDARVQQLAAKLHIEAFLERLPSELSGGQQQRVALARALAKRAPLMLLDEPLVNLDYKLREELREELSALFASGDDWDDQLASWESGWPDFFRILRLYLTHFRGQRGAAFQTTSRKRRRSPSRGSRGSS